MRAFAGFRAVLCLSTALMMAISWPLWVTGGSFPRVPWFGWVRLLPAWASWVRFAVLLFGLIAASIPPAWTLSRFRSPLELSAGAAKRGWESGTAALTLALALSAWMVLEDQFRLQPWFYQFLLAGSALAACPMPRAATLCRVSAIALYFHSGLSKLDHGFVGGMGQTFLDQAAKFAGGDPRAWTPSTREALTLAMPSFEIAVACLLAFRWRRIGAAAAVGLHVVLVAILGPWGLAHSANVLIWNGAMAAEVACLFAFVPAAGHPAPISSRSGRFASMAATVAVIASTVLPFGERSGYWDTWPSFGLYSAPRQVVDIQIVVRPESTFAVNGEIEGNYAVLVDPSEWSLRERRVPVYPSARAMNGIAEALARTQVGNRAVKLSIFHPDRRAFLGLDAIRKHGDTFWLNAHPAQ